MTGLQAVLLAAVMAQSTGWAASATGDDRAIALQVALDRAGFSSGVIDGRIGANTKRALEAYRQRHGSEPTPQDPALLDYRITADDLRGPFVERIPQDLVEQSKLPALSYRSVAEALAERFHTTPEVLQRLNPGATFADGSIVRVPNVEPFVVPPVEADATAKPTGTSGRGETAPPAAAKKSDQPDVVVRVSRAARSVTVSDASGNVVLFAPVTTGSERDPLPLGEWKVNGVQKNPTFRYNPDLFWDADPTHTKATVPAGPNGPVGVVWIDISKEHYGLHGTPEPSQIGRTESHGCVRLTNWDAWRLGALVKPGTKVIFAE